MTSVNARASPTVRRAAVLAFPVIILVIFVLFGIAFLVTALLGLPPSLGLPLAVRAIGVLIMLAGLLVMGWLFRHRGPVNVLVSTYVTFMKIFRRTPMAERSDRTEPLVVSGPQRYVRHPLYAGVVVMTLGWALVASATFVLVATAVVFLWFRLLLIPFEEKELRALFGGEYEEYCERVPMMVPFTNRKPKKPLSKPQGR